MPRITLIEQSSPIPSSSATPAASQNKRIRGTANQLGGWKTVCAIFLFGATTVIASSFQGTFATSFTVSSGTQITATVPAGATTGWIAVRTAGGRVQSVNTFTVTP